MPVINHVSNLCPRQGAGGVLCCARFISNKKVFSFVKKLFTGNWPPFTSPHRYLDPSQYSSQVPGDLSVLLTGTSHHIVFSSQISCHLTILVPGNWPSHSSPCRYLSISQVLCYAVVLLQVPGHRSLLFTSARPLPSIHHRYQAVAITQNSLQVLGL